MLLLRFSHKFKMVFFHSTDRVSARQYNDVNRLIGNRRLTPAAARAKATRIHSVLKSTYGRSAMKTYEISKRLRHLIIRPTRLSGHIRNAGKYGPVKFRGRFPKVRVPVGYIPAANPSPPRYPNTPPSTPRRTYSTSSSSTMSFNPRSSGSSYWTPGRSYSSASRRSFPSASTYADSDSTFVPSPTFFRRGGAAYHTPDRGTRRKYSDPEVQASADRLRVIRARRDQRNKRKFSTPPYTFRATPRGLRYRKRGGKMD